MAVHATGTPAAWPRGRAGYDANVRFVIVGGGIAGLAAALRLRDRATVDGPTVDIVVVERARPAGRQAAHRAVRATPRSRPGPRSFLMRDQGDRVRGARAWPAGSDSATTLVHPAPVPAAIALRRRPAPAARPAPCSAYRPTSSTLDGLARRRRRRRRPRAADRCAGEDIAVGALVRQRLGDDVVDRLVDPLLGGVYAGRADDLSLAATMPALHAAARPAPSLAAAVRAAVAAAARPPGPAGLRHRPGWTVPAGRRRCRGRPGPSCAAAAEPVRELAPHRRGVAPGRRCDPSTRGPLDADAVVLAVPARPAARLLERVDPDRRGRGRPAGLRERGPGHAGPAGRDRAAGAVRVPGAGGTRASRSRRPRSSARSGRSGATPTVLVRASLGRYGEEAVLQQHRRRPGRAGPRRAGRAARTGRCREPVAARVNRWGGGAAAVRRRPRDPGRRGPGRAAADRGAGRRRLRRGRHRRLRTLGGGRGRCSSGRDQMRWGE